MDGDKNQAISFFQKNKTICPVCETGFFREELLTGRGRLIAGNLTRELRRLYEPSKKFGTIHPLIYTVTVCPNCYFASWKEDFLRLPPEKRDLLHDGMENRIKLISGLLQGVDFRAPRRLDEGLASYILALMCYDEYTKDFSPIIKQGISALRAAWLAIDLHKEQPEENFMQLAKMMYHKASFFYSYALESEQNGNQSIGGCPNLGPDLDKNYAYDGMIYLSGYLEFYFGPKDNTEVRRQRLDRSKRAVARIFGMGKASKSKPQAILDNARELYQSISQSLGIINPDPEKDAKEE